MKLFHCSHCRSVVFFDSFLCVQCGSTLAFIPQDLRMAALTPAAGTPDAWECLAPQSPPQDTLAASQGKTLAAPSRAPADERLQYRLCANRHDHNACNFALSFAADDGAVEGNDRYLCVSCRQTRVRPDLSDAQNIRRWTEIELAKRRLYYSLARLGLEHIEGEAGPVFEFLADTPGTPPVLTGHASGVITLNVAEADDDERARRRLALGEPYRTLLGHLRHESGHYFWDLLVLRGGHAEAFRAVFGDERFDYKEALQAHYARAPHTGWQEQFVSAYATAHPWEDWAETWAHYLHMVDLLETAESYQAEITVPGPHDAPRYAMVDPFASPAPDFAAMLRACVPLTLLLNSLTRSLGQPDAYPFALSAGAQAKLRFVHALIHGQITAPPQPTHPGSAAEAVDAPAACTAGGALAQPSAPQTVEAG